MFAQDGPLDPRDPANSYHGGPFAAVELGNSGLVHLNLDDDDIAR